VGKYLFYGTANRQQDDIWEYTKNMWGDNQAKEYIYELHAHISKTAAREVIWKEIIELNSSFSVYCTSYKKHVIFFRELSDGIGIMSILHQAMDIPTRLQEDILKQKF